MNTACDWGALVTGGALVGDGHTCWTGNVCYDANARAFEGERCMCSCHVTGYGVPWSSWTGRCFQHMHESCQAFRTENGFDPKDTRRLPTDHCQCPCHGLKEPQAPVAAMPEKIPATWTRQQAFMALQFAAIVERAKQIAAGEPDRAALLYRLERVLLRRLFAQIAATTPPPTYTLGCGITVQGPREGFPRGFDWTCTHHRDGAWHVAAFNSGFPPVLSSASDPAYEWRIE